MSVLLTMAFPTYTDDDPFIVERHYSLYLNGKVLEDGWDVLAALNERSGENVELGIVVCDAGEFIQAGTQGFIPIPFGMRNRLLQQGLVEGKAISGPDRVDLTELKLSFHGMSTLADHIKAQSR
jgi:hypothetical protein